MEAVGMGMSGHNPRRVLLLTRGGPANGCQHQMRYLIEDLDRQRYEPIVVGPSAGGALADIAALGVRTHVMPMRDWRRFPQAVARPLDQWRLRRWAAAMDVALVHAADVWKGRYAIQLGRAMRIPSIVHIRGPMRKRDVRKHRVADATGLIVIAQRFVDDLLGYGIEPDKVTLIDDGVSTSLYRPAQPGDADVLGDDYPQTTGVRIAMVGRIERFKRQVEFIDIIAPLVQQMPEAATFYIIGEAGEERYHAELLEALAHHGLANRVILTGRRNDFPAVMRSLDVLVTLSGGSVMFEAMACEKAVVSVRDDVRHSIHVRDGETGLRVTGTDRSVATAAIRRLIQDASLRQQLGRAGRKWAQTHLSSRRMAEQTAELYDRLLVGLARPVRLTPTVTARPAPTWRVPQAPAGSTATHAAARDTGCGSE